ncbi:MAG: 3-oxoacyl-[acyl-carrier-protein] reductase FabG [Nitrospira sp.]|nr:3-oxoacyl-[acyl-carrier-protein] reductase FabG [Nitrospira sp.]
MALIFHKIRRMSLAVVPHMSKRNWGRIISVTGHLESPGRLGGGLTSKAAVHGFSKGLSDSVAPHGVTVNCISPGKIVTEQVLRKYTPERFEQTGKKVPIGRWGKPEEFAPLAVFLASPLACYITGTIMHVDGGYKRYAF